MAKVIEENGHDYALFGGGLLGFEIGAGLAARLNAGVTMEVTQVNVADGKLTAERPILGDSSISTSSYKDKGIIIGRLNAFETKETGGSATVEDVQVELSPWSTKAKMVQRGEQRGADVDIEGADILVAGGRGLGKAEGVELGEQLAGAFGGNSAVAATRAVVDAGWYPYAAQIGQTGKTVAPKLYLAAGISGAIQHKVGMQGSENIVAINKDANAPIFEFSDLGIVGDLNKILPKLTEAIKAKKGG
jgi:electron transfer flavoprotein alpha subunit